MTTDSNLDLLDKWAMTKDKKEFIEIGMKLSPESTRQEMEKLADEALVGYQTK
ncbi:MAG: hypothetical protein ACTTJE_09270 [Schwartzia sp. (in: firmicutes)]